MVGLYCNSLVHQIRYLRQNLIDGMHQNLEVSHAVVTFQRRCMWTTKRVVLIYSVGT